MAPVGAPLPLDDLRARLAAHADPARAASSAAYLKSELDFLGVRMPTLRTEGLAWWRARRSGAALRPTVDALWATSTFELRAVGVELVVAEQRHLGVADAAWLEGLVRGCGTWALLDTLVIKAVGPATGRDPAWHPVVERWSRDPDFWVQRAAVLSFLLSLRRGAGDWERFSAVADRLLPSTEFFVRKAIGWTLREAGKREPERVAGWLAARLDRVSGLTLREGSRNLPDELRSRLR